MPKTDRGHLRREKLLFEYSTALEVGDFAKVANVLAVAENDPLLERMILEINEQQLLSESAQSLGNTNHKGQTMMTVVSNSMPKLAPEREQSRWSGVAAMVAAILVIAFTVFILLQSDNEPPAGSMQPADTSTPLPTTIPTNTMDDNFMTATVMQAANEQMQNATPHSMLQQTQAPQRTLQAPTVPPPVLLPTSTFIGVPPILPFEGSLAYPDFDRIFRGIDGTFVLYDPQNDVSVVYNPDRAQQRFAPHSTFKILNAAIGLETGAVPDEDFVIEWDQEQYPLTEYPETSPYNEWRQDHTLQTGMQYSVVWFYTEVARRVGQDQMAEWVDAVGYGNMETSAWLDDVPFWLDGSLQISPLEQTQFLWRFYDGQLDFSERTTDIVKDIIILEETATYRLSGKTGTSPDGLGWLVGYVERGDEVYMFALNMDLQGTDRMELTREVLTAMGLLN